jgi:hypothetical protein
MTFASFFLSRWLFSEPAAIRRSAKRQSDGPGRGDRPAEQRGVLPGLLDAGRGAAGPGEGFVIGAAGGLDPDLEHFFSLSSLVYVYTYQILI